MPLLMHILSLLTHIHCYVQIRSLDCDTATLFIDKSIDIASVHLVYNVIKGRNEMSKRFEEIPIYRSGGPHAKEVFTISMPSGMPANRYYAFEVTDVYGDSFYTEGYYLGSDRQFYEKKPDRIRRRARDDEPEMDEKARPSMWNVWTIVGAVCIGFLVLIIAIVSGMIIYKRMKTPRVILPRPLVW